MGAIAYFVASLCFAQCSAFVPSTANTAVRMPVRNTGMRRPVSMGLNDMIGGSVEPYAPVPALKGGDYMKGASEAWDPMNFAVLSEVYPEWFWPDVEWLREAELKHCRAAMLATVGVWAQHFGLTKLYPDMDPNTKWYNSLAEYSEKHPEGLAQIFLLIAVIEGKTFKGQAWARSGPAGQTLKIKDPSKIKDRARLVELKNGRLAMIGFAGFWAAAAIPGAVPIIGADF